MTSSSARKAMRGSASPLAKVAGTVVTIVVLAVLFALTSRYEPTPPAGGAIETFRSSVDTLPS